MSRRSILAAAVIAASLPGTDASPCKPPTSAAISAVQSETSSTVVSEASSTVLFETFLTPSTEATSDNIAETTSTAELSSPMLLDTSLTTLVEATPTTLDETASIPSEATTSAVLTEESSTILAASTTTIEAEACVETQFVINPGFDNGDDGFRWTHNGEVKRGWFNPSYPNNLEVMLYPDARESVFSQTLGNIKAGEYKLAYRWRLLWAEGGRDRLGCYIRPQVGNTYFDAEFPDRQRDSFSRAVRTWSAAQDFNEVKLEVMVACSGDFDSLNFNFDDITLTSICADDVKTPIA